MDFKQALEHRGGGNASSNNNNSISSNNSKSSANSVHSDGGNNSSCSNNTSANTHTEESNRGGSPVPAPLLLCSNNNSRISSVSHFSRPRPASELEGAAHTDPRLLKLARLHDLPSPHSSALETQVLINLNGSLQSSNGAAHHHPQLSSYLSSSNHSSNHGSPTANYAGSVTATATPTSSGFFNNGSSTHSRLYPFASLHEDPIRQQQSPYLLSAVPVPQAALLASARAHHAAALPCFNSEPAVPTIFTAEQLLEFTQQTFVFKHFAAGVTPPASLLLPIINSVASMGRVGVGAMHYGSNAGLFGVGSLRGNIDPEPGRCRRTDGKKWRCAREVVADQKYCERHMHRGRHRARNKVANGGTDTLNTPASGLPLTAATNTVNTHTSSGICTPVSTTFATTAAKEPHLHFSLQPASAGSSQLNRLNNHGGSDDNNTQQKPAVLSGPAGGLKRLLESNNIGGPLSRSLAAQPQNPPNLAELLNANSSAKSSLTTNHHITSLDPPFPFACLNRDADSLAPRHFVGGGDHWSRISSAADNPPPNSGLSWFDQLAEEQNKRSRFNTELSIATHKSPLVNLSAKFGGDQQEDLVGADASHFMGLSMDLGPKVSGISKLEEDRYSGRSSWVPIAWESPAIGGPLGEVLQSNAANSGGNYSGSLANSGGERCLNLIEDESWVHQEGGHVSSPAKDSHSPSLASPTGVLQMKASFASYSDSSSSASSPRSALKLDSANLGI